jgi:dTDP-4-amino-4,6-dideoxygalactose transaminase
MLGVHVWGNPCAIDALTKIAEQSRLELLFDAAHAFACSHNGQMIGNFGNAEVFSFHATKMVNAGEGGAVTTNDDALAAELRRLRNFGIEHGQVVGLGINGKMSEFAAAVGLTSLESCDEFIAHNSANLESYKHFLAGIAGLEVLAESTSERRNFQYVVVEVDPTAAGRSRDDIVAALHAQNVFAKRYFSPGCHQIAPYRSLCGDQPASLPHTERLCSRLLQLPTGTAVSQNQIEQIGCFLRQFLSRARAAA